MRTISYYYMYKLCFTSISFSSTSSTTIHYLLLADQEHLVRLLLDAGAAVDAQSVNGGTPLMRAVQTSQSAIVKLLLERGFV